MTYQAGRGNEGASLMSGYMMEVVLGCGLPNLVQLFEIPSFFRLPSIFG
jgi:hypothetical protein